MKFGSEKRHDIIPLCAIDPDLEEKAHLDAIAAQLAESALFTQFSRAIKKLRIALHQGLLTFGQSVEERFAKEIIYRLMEESLAYLGNLRNGTFSAGCHNIRALLELYATVEYVMSDTGKKKNFLERFNLYPTVEFHKVFHQYPDAFISLPEELSRKHLSEYENLPPEFVKIFGKNTLEEVLEMKNWRGNCKISNLLDKCPSSKTAKANYDKLSLFTHISSICRRSETVVFPKFDKGTEAMLLIAVRLTVFSYICLKQHDIPESVLQNKLDDIFLPLADVLSDSHEPSTSKDVNLER
ncbi:MAG: hypothetical protein KR126chlam2_01091 [Chlamydiae bacterium]|nr:hypothetical protein [Chlamydiota bacterium]